MSVMSSNVKSWRSAGRLSTTINKVPQAKSKPHLARKRHPATRVTVFSPVPKSQPDRAKTRPKPAMA
jgi:hypothetical protein